MSLNEQTSKPLASLSSLSDASGARRTKLSLLRFVRPASPSGFSRSLTFSFSPTKYLHSNSNTSRLFSRLPASDSLPSTLSNLQQQSERSSNEHNKTASGPSRGDIMMLKCSHPNTPNHISPLGTRKKIQKVSPSSIFSTQDDPFRYSRGLAAWVTPKEPKDSDGGIGKRGASEIEFQSKSKSSPNFFSDTVDVLPRNISEPEGSIPVGTPGIETFAQGEDVVSHGTQSLTRPRLDGPSLSQLQTPTPLLRARILHAFNQPPTSDLGPLLESSPAEAEATTKSNSMPSLTSQQSSQRNHANLEPCDLGISNNMPVTHAIAILSRSQSDVFLSATTTANKSCAILKPISSHRRSYSTQGQIEHVSSGAHRRALKHRPSNVKLQDSKFQDTLNRSDPVGEANRISQRKEVLPETVRIHSLHSRTEDSLNGHVPGSEPSNTASESATPLTAFATDNGAMEKPISCDISLIAPTRNRIRRRGLIFDNFPLPLASLLGSETKFETHNQVDPEAENEEADDVTTDFLGATARSTIEEDDVRISYLSLKWLLALTRYCTIQYSSVSETLESYFDTFDASASTAQPELEFALSPEHQTIANQTNHAVSRPITPLPSISIDPENQTSTKPCALDSSTGSGPTTSYDEIPACTSLESSSRAASLASATQLSSEMPSNAHFSLPHPMSGSSRSPRRHHALLRLPSPLRSEITPSPPSQAKLGLRLRGYSSNINSDINSFASIPATARIAATRAVTWAAQRGMRIKEMVSLSSHAPGHESQIGRSSSTSEVQFKSPPSHSRVAQHRDRSGSIRHGGLKIFTRAVPMKLPARAFARGRSLSHNEKTTAIPTSPQPTSPAGTAPGAPNTTAENATPEPANSDSQQRLARSASLDSGAPLGGARSGEVGGT